MSELSERGARALGKLVQPMGSGNRKPEEHCPRALVMKKAASKFTIKSLRKILKGRE